MPATTAIPTAPITTDLPCMKCGYNLRTRTADDLCPECGWSVARSIRHMRKFPRFLSIAMGAVLFIVLAGYDDLYRIAVLSLEPWIYRHIKPRDWYTAMPILFDTGAALIFLAGFILILRSRYKPVGVPAPGRRVAWMLALLLVGIWCYDGLAQTWQHARGVALFNFDFDDHLDVALRWALQSVLLVFAACFFRELAKECGHDWLAALCVLLLPMAAAVTAATGVLEACQIRLVPHANPDQFYAGIRAGLTYLRAVHWIMQISCWSLLGAWALFMFARRAWRRWASARAGRLHPRTVVMGSGN